MIFNRKFYNNDAVETPAATEISEPVSLATLMAKEGNKSEGNHGETQNTNTEKPETPTETKTETPAAIAAEVKVEEVKTETPTSAEVKEEVVTPAIVEPTTPAPSWQEVAQKQPNEVLKALGYDEQVATFLGDLKELDPKVIGLLQAYKEGKQVEYLRELSTDYSKLSAEEVMRHQLRKDYPKASERHLDVLYNREVVAAYNLDSDDAELLEEGKLLLEAKADRYRDSLIENQAKFLVPVHTAKTEQPDNTKVLEGQLQAEADRKFNEAYRAEVENNALTKNIISNKAFSIGEGEGKFNFPVVPEDVMNILFDHNKFKQALWDTQIDANGQVDKLVKPKTEHQILVATVMKYGMPFIDSLKEHFTSLGARSAIAPIDNAKEPEKVNTSNADIKPASTAAAMAKSGTYSPGGG